MSIPNTVERSIEEDVEEMDVGEAPPTRELVPEQAPAPPVTLLATAGIWVGSRGDQVARQGLATSLRARCKAPTIQVE